MISLRNANFTLSKFSHLKIHKLPELDKNELEGYEIEDEHSGYVIEDLYSGPIRVYNKSLLKKYEKFYSNKKFNEVKVFETWWGNYEIYATKFDKTLIEYTKFDDIYFSNVSCNDVIFDNVIFYNMDFEYQTKLVNTSFRNCYFEKCSFKDVNFVNSKFIRCEFHKSSFYRSKLDISLFNSEFNRFTFNYCEIDKLPISKNNKFNNIEIFMCTNKRSFISTEDFRKLLNE